MSAIPPILVIGDSHSSFFGGTETILPFQAAAPLRGPVFEVHHVGPGLAASLVERESENNTRAKALNALRGRDPATTRAVILCFGEIDCRFHIVRRAGSDAFGNKTRLRRSIEVTAHRYLSFVLEVALAGFRPIIFGPIATTLLRYEPPYEWPTLGSTVERNEVTRELNDMLCTLSMPHRIDFISIFECLIDHTLQTRNEFYFDGVHLGRAAWPLFVNAMQESSPDLLPLLEASSLG